MLHLESRINWCHREPLESWLENALVTISPSGDYLLMSGRTPEPITFIAKLKKDPINQYVIKQLNVALDMDEHVTSLLCLPVMSTQKTALGCVDWTVFVVGLSSGYVRFYTEQSNCMISLKFLDESIVNIKCQTRKINTNARSASHFATLFDELLIVHKANAIVIDGLSLFDNLRIAKGDIIRNGIDYEPAYNLKNMPSILQCVQWRLEPDIVDCELLGTRVTTTFDSIKNKSINASSVSAKSYARSLAVIGSRPFLTCYRESPDSTPHSYTEMLGSLLSIWNRAPEPSRYQLSQVTKSTAQSFFDKDRRATSIVASPDKRLVAITDDFGRILLVDVTNWLIIRMWKGYRSSQCGWVEVKRDPESRTTAHATFLVIYAPKRGLLEVWATQRGPRIAAMNVGKGCRLIYSGYKMFNMRLSKQGIADALNPTTKLLEQAYSTNCYLLNGRSEIVSCLNLPYTYSLYKQSDFKSRDKLLIGELSTSIEQGAQTEVHSDIIHRLSLSESIETAIEMVCLGLSKDEVLVIMENLINKTMHNYDNHPGEIMTTDDKRIIELCKRIIKLCTLYDDLSQTKSQGQLISLDAHQSLVDRFDEHPKDVDEFAEKLGWSVKEVLRYLSLGALERSLKENVDANPWPYIGESTLWTEFISCFDIISSSSTGISDQGKQLCDLPIRLKRLDNNFLTSDSVFKTSLLLYTPITQAFYQKSVKTTQDYLPLNEVEVQKVLNTLNFIEPASRLALLLRFWLSTNLSSQWKMWAFIQAQVDLISDELKVISMERNGDALLVQVWKRTYQLILESDNLYGAIIANATLRAVTIRTIKDNQKRDKMAKNDDPSSRADDEEDVDWELLCIDAERMSIVGQQLEDVFLLNLLLRYSFQSSLLVSSHQFKIGQISVANILRAGPTIVSELVAQWVIQSHLSLETLTLPYGGATIEESKERQVVFDQATSIAQQRAKSSPSSKQKSPKSNDEHAKELLHHVKTAFPRSLEPDVVLVYCVCESGALWTSGLATSDKLGALQKILECLRSISCVELSHKLSTITYKSFFQLTFERLVSLVESNTSLVTIKNSRIKDGLTRKELNMGEDCLDEFVEFCLHLTDFMMQSKADMQVSNLQAAHEFGQENSSSAFEEDDLSSVSSQATYRQHLELLLTLDDWWQTPEANQPDTANNCRSENTACWQDSTHCSAGPKTPTVHSAKAQSLVMTTLNSSDMFSMDALIELNKLATVMNLIFKLRIARACPKSLIGEESRTILQLDLRQTPPTSRSQVPSRPTPKPDSSASRATDVNELRMKFARKCIFSAVGKLDEETDEFDEVDCKRESETMNRTVSVSTNVNANKQTVSVDLFSIDKTKANKSSTMPSDNVSLQANNGVQSKQFASSEAMRLFAQLLSLASDWRLDRDELHLEFVFELYRCNHDKLASQLAHRIVDQQTLAKGLLKIASQRTLVLAGLSPQLSGSKWRLRTQAWSVFAPNLSNWLRTIQSEEMKREIPALSFNDCYRVDEDGSSGASNQLCLVEYVVQTLRHRTRMLLDRINNNLSGADERLARELVQALDSEALSKIIGSNTVSEAT